ncbi:cytochrome P450 [Auricularia subglabra TFB-10046 SS5]|nr:cytochrome P450 [Auricularia subglabra TFB-10046 SS5]
MRGNSRSAGPHLDGIPSVGIPSGPFRHIRAAFSSFRDARQWIVQGYEKYHGGLFKILTFNEWTVLVTSEQLVDELRKAPDSVLSFTAAAEDAIQEKYVFGDNRLEGNFHLSVIRSKLSRQLGAVFPAVKDEISASFADNIRSGSTDEWVKVPAYDMSMNVIARTSSRLFVGLPMCRNEEYIDLIINYTITVVVASNLIRQFPWFLQPFVGRYCTPLTKTFRRALQLVGPIIDERRAALESHGKDWEEKPNDMITWLLESANEEQKETEFILTWILRMNFAAIHTTGITFTFALFHLAAEADKYVPPLRAEIEAAIAKDGWTKDAVSRMNKLDSFIRESNRHHSLGAISMQRKALKPYTFSDGTYIPVGTNVATASLPIHMDERLHGSNAQEFDGFRYVPESANDDVNSDELSTHRLVSTSVDYLIFGHGKHACPGRFWAGNEMKAMFAWLIMEYDIKMDGGKMPDTNWMGVAGVPDSKACVLLRRRHNA